MRAKRFMKYAPHPDAEKRAQQMVWRGRGRTSVQAVRNEPPVDAPAANPLPVSLPELEADAVEQHAKRKR